MKHTKKQRRAMADALEAALPYLWDGKGSRKDTFPWICTALTEASMQGSNPLDCTTARVEIMRRLGGLPNVAAWLHYRGFVADPFLHHPIIQAYRRRWMLALIEEFRS